MEECPICLEAMEAGTMVTPCCDQQMHVACRDGWIARSTNCPMCRARQRDPIAADIERPLLIVRADPRRPLPKSPVATACNALTAVVVGGYLVYIFVSPYM